MKLWFIALMFIISIISGLLAAITINRFENNKIEQWSFEYQVFGFGGTFLCVFGMIISIGGLMNYIVNLIMA